MMAAPSLRSSLRDPRQAPCVDESDVLGAPPPIIDLIAENYRFKYVARCSGIDFPPRLEPHERIVHPILMPHPHVRQTCRTVHFRPRTGDIVHKNAHVFDVDAAIFELQEQKNERQEIALSEAARLCEELSLRSARRSVSSAQSPRSSSWQSRPASASPGAKPAPPARKRSHVTEKKEKVLNEALTISKVSSSANCRRPSTAKVPKKPIIVDGPSTFSSQKRFSSPPPKGSQVRVVTCKLCEDELRIETVESSFPEIVA
jgi:hypothetical protein